MPILNLHFLIFYSTIIILGVCIIPYFIFSSFQNFRIINFILEFIIFCIITFNSKLKNHYLWENTNFEPIQKLPYPIITDIKMNHLSKYVYDLNIITSYQYFSIIKTTNYSKECLLNYFIKETEKCPITDIIINDNNNILKDYSVIELETFNISFIKNKIGKLYKSFYYLDDSIKFESAIDSKDISLIKMLEIYKLYQPFSKLKKYCSSFDYIWLILYPISFIYYFRESRDDRKWNYFRVIDYISQIILIIIYTIRFSFFIVVKNFFKKIKEENINIDLKNFKIDKYKSSYYPNFNINAESFPVAIGISMIFYFLLFLLIKNKWSCQKKKFENENKEVKQKINIYFLLFPCIIF